MQLTIDNLTQQYGSVRVLDQLALSTGSIGSLVLVGPSGGGGRTPQPGM